MKSTQTKTPHLLMIPGYSMSFKNNILHYTSNTRNVEHHYLEVNVNLFSLGSYNFIRYNETTYENNQEFLLKISRINKGSITLPRDHNEYQIPQHCFNLIRNINRCTQKIYWGVLKEKHMQKKLFFTGRRFLRLLKQFYPGIVFDL